MRNTYFEKMKEEGKRWIEAKEVRKAEKLQLENKGDWDGVKAWNEREKREFPFPFTRGQDRAYRAYEDTNYYGASEFMVKELPWETGTTEDFVKTMKEAGITEFVTTDESTALMRVLHELDALGCKMVGLTTITIKDAWSKEDKIQNGIRMRIA